MNDKQSAELDLSVTQSTRAETLFDGMRPKEEGSRRKPSGGTHEELMYSMDLDTEISFARRHAVMVLLSILEV